MTDPVDRAYLERMKSDLGGGDILADLIEIFLEEAPKHLETMERALEEDEPDDLRIAAHTMKSSAGQLGAKGLSEQAKELEEIGDSGDISEAAGKVQQARDTFDAVREELEAYRDELA